VGNGARANVRFRVHQDFSPGCLRLFRPCHAGRASARNASLRQLIAAAYHLDDFLIDGGTNWTATDRFDIEAKAPESAAPPKADPAAPVMVRVLNRRHIVAQNAPLDHLIETLTCAFDYKLEWSPVVNGRRSQAHVIAGGLRLNSPPVTRSPALH
jgi:hypothetical protein